jgi:hypothetical protein
MKYGYKVKYIFWLKYFTYHSVLVLAPKYKQHSLSPARVRKVCYSLAELYVRSVYLSLFRWRGARRLWNILKENSSYKSLGTSELDALKCYSSEFTVGTTYLSQTLDITPWTGDRPIARTLHRAVPYRNTNTRSWVEWKFDARSKCPTDLSHCTSPTAQPLREAADTQTHKDSWIQELI